MTTMMLTRDEVYVCRGATALVREEWNRRAQAEIGPPAINTDDPPSLEEVDRPTDFGMVHAMIAAVRVADATQQALRDAWGDASEIDLPSPPDLALWVWRYATALAADDELLPVARRLVPRLEATLFALARLSSRT